MIRGEIVTVLDLHFKPGHLSHHIRPHHQILSSPTSHQCISYPSSQRCSSPPSPKQASSGTMTPTTPTKPSKIFTKHRTALMCASSTTPTRQNGLPTALEYKMVRNWESVSVPRMRIGILLINVGRDAVR